MTTFAVITEIGEGNYACSELLIDPDAPKHVVGANIIVDAARTPEMFADAIKFRDGGKTKINLNKKQLLFCNTPVFKLGEILVVDSNDRTIPDGRKPSKWDVRCEYFNNIESAIKKSKEVFGD